MSGETDLEEKYLRLYENSMKQAEELMKKGVTSVAALIREKIRLEKTLEELQSSFHALEQEHARCFKTDLQSEFQRQKSWFMRIRFILANEKRVLSASEIEQLYYKYDPDFDDQGSSLRNRLQHALHAAIRSGTLIYKETPGAKGFWYGLPHYFNANGTVKPEFAI